MDEHESKYIAYQLQKKFERGNMTEHDHGVREDLISQIYSPIGIKIKI